MVRGTSEAARTRRGRRPWARLALAVALAAGLAAEASAFVPPSDKIANAVARANRAAGRPQSLILSVALRGDDDRTLARGELASDGRGLARLELADGGTSERYLLRGGEYLAARDGRRIADPAPWLPPLYLLQARSADRLLAGVLSLGGATETVLGRHDGAVCYVLGGRDLAPPANESAARLGSSGPRGSVWARREDFRIVRIDRPDGTRFVLGPPRDHDGVTLPEWIRIERPGASKARLEILGARASRFDPAVTFGAEWLFGR